jgi:hypothetical protein
MKPNDACDSNKAGSFRENSQTAPLKWSRISIALHRDPTQARHGEIGKPYLRKGMIL